MSRLQLLMHTNSIQAKLSNSCLDDVWRIALLTITKFLCLLENKKGSLASEHIWIMSEMEGKVEQKSASCDLKIKI